MSDPAPLPTDKPAPPPGLITPGIPTTVPMPPASAAAPPAVPGVGHEFSITLTSSWLDWVPAVALTTALLLTFFVWVGAYPGGHRLFGQSAWDAVGSGISPTVPTDLVDLERKLETAVRSNWLMLPYLVLLIAAVALAWIERFVKEPNAATLPGPLAWLPGVWHMRFMVLTSLCAFLLFVISVQTLRGFGLQHAVQTVAAEKFEKELAATDLSSSRKKDLEIKIGLEKSQLAVQTTTWLFLAVVAHIVALLGILGRLWLGNRGSQPMPRLVLRY